MAPSRCGLHLAACRVSGANCPARNFDQLVERNRRRPAAVHGGQPCVDLRGVAFVLALSQLEVRTSHVKSAQSTPVVYHQRSTVEETLDSLLRIGLRAVREI